MVNFSFPKVRSTAIPVPVVSFDQMVFGTNLDNEYVPVYSVYIRQEILNVDKGYMYFKPLPGNYYRYSYSNYDAFFDGLSGSSMGQYIFTVDGRDHKLLIFNNYIADMEGRILLMMTMKDYVIDREDNPDNYKLIVSSDFVTNPIYKNVWKQVEKKYISDVQESGIDIEYTNSDKIEERFFNGMPKISYSSITQLNNIKKKYHEYFQWVSLLDEGQFYMGLDYQPPALIKPGYRIENLKVDDESFQALLWQFIQDGVYYSKLGSIVPFWHFIQAVENSNSRSSVRFTCQHGEGLVSEYNYYPEDHHIYDIRAEKNYYLRLTSKNMVKSLSEKLPQTLWKIQNYVNFVQHKVSDDGEIDSEIGASALRTSWSESDSRWNIQVPEGMEVTGSTPHWAIG